MRKIIVFLALISIILSTTFGAVACSTHPDSYEIKITAEEGITVKYEKKPLLGMKRYYLYNGEDLIGEIYFSSSAEGETALSINQGEVPSFYFSIKNSYDSPDLKAFVNGIEVDRADLGTGEVGGSDGRLYFFAENAAAVTGAITINITGINQ